MLGSPMFRSWLELARISNLPTVWTNVTAAWLLAGGPWKDVRLVWLLIAGSLLYTGGMILNDAADAKHDREHKKERPIPQGRISLAAAWTVGLGMLLVGLPLAVGFAGAHWAVCLGLIAAILFYDFYHKPWPGAVWVMGSCRALLFLMAATAVQPSVTGPVITMALTLGAYIVGLTMVARMEAKGASVSRARALFAKTLLYSPALVALFFWVSTANWKLISLLGDLTPLVPLPLILIFVAMVVHATRVMKKGGPAIGQAVGILLAGVAVVDALTVMQVSLPLAGLFVALAPCLRLWQRVIAAT